MTKKPTKTILIAEDDAGIIDVMKIILEQEGYRVATAKNKAEVDSALQKTLPNLIFLDIRLGGENGAEIAKELRTEKKTAGVPLIIVSGDSQAEEIARKVNATGYLSKPFDITTLLSLISTHIT